MAELSALPFAMQHLKTGYCKEYSELKNLEKRILKHNEQLEKFVTSLCRKIEEELKLPEPPRKKRFAYYRRIVAMSLRKIITGYPEKGPKVTPIGSMYVLKWNDTGVIGGSREDCEKGLLLIKKHVHLTAL